MKVWKWGNFFKIIGNSKKDLLVALEDTKSQIKRIVMFAVLLYKFSKFRLKFKCYNQIIFLWNLTSLKIYLIPQKSWKVSNFNQGKNIMELNDERARMVSSRLSEIIFQNNSKKTLLDIFSIAFSCLPWNTTYLIREYISEKKSQN